MKPRSADNEAVVVIEAVNTSSSGAAPTAQSQSAAMRLLFAVAFISLLIDQFSKSWIRTSLPLGDEIQVIPGFMHLSHIANHGAAWGMLAGRRWLLIGVSLAVVVALAAGARQIAARGRFVATGMGFIFGGAVGNLIDRVFFGWVTDMIDMDTSISFIRNFPVFNVADSALTVGVCILIIHTLFGERESA